MMGKKKTNFLLKLEPAIRPIVLALREHGINTTGSCGHEMWVECDSYDSTSDFSTIFAVLHDMGYREFTIEHKWEVRKTDIARSLIIQINEKA